MDLPAPWRKIFYMHIIAAVLHTFAFAITFYLTKDEATIPITTHFPDKSFNPDMQHVQDAASGYLTVFYSLPSAIEHIISIVFLARNSHFAYTDYLSKNVDILRWLSYSISAPIMMVQMCMRSGVFDPVLLSAVAFLYFTMMIFGFITESLYFTKIDTYYVKLTLYAGWAPFIGAWIILFVYFFRAASSGTAPWWVYTIVISEFFIMNLFGAVLVYGVNRHNVSVQHKSVVAIRMIASYILLSLTAKLVLASLNWYGSQSVKK